MRALALGGCGAQGTFAVRDLVKSKDVSHLIIADIDLEKAKKVAADMASPKRSPTISMARLASSRILRGSSLALSLSWTIFRASFSFKSANVLTKSLAMVLYLLLPNKVLAHPPSH